MLQASVHSKLWYSPYSFQSWNPFHYGLQASLGQSSQERQNQCAENSVIIPAQAAELLYKGRLKTHRVEMRK